MTEPKILDKPAKQTSSFVAEPRAITPDGFDVKQLEADNLECEQETAYNFNRADLMLRSIVRENRKPSFAELTFFKSQCGWDEPEFGRQFRRMNSVLRLQGIVGSSTQRQSAFDEKSKSAEILTTEGPKIAASIAKLVEQKAALERSAIQAERRVEQIGEALEQLQKTELLRPDLASKHRLMAQAFAPAERIGELRVELSLFENLLNGEPADERTRQFWLESWNRFDHEACSYKVGPGGIKSLQFSEPELSDRKRSMIAERETMRIELEKLEALQGEHNSKLAEIAGFYLSEKK